MHFLQFIFHTVPLLTHFFFEKYFQDEYSKTLNSLESKFHILIPGTYEFVIFGGGTAGCVLAARLSEKHTVLLLEAGGTPPPASVVPYLSSSVMEDPRINYYFESIQQQNASLYNGGILKNQFGKVLGGSGSYNELMHNRGSPRDFDHWATITEDESWNYENVLKYFKMTESFVGVTHSPVHNEKYYGRNGPIQVDTNVSPMLPLWFQAGKELGYETNDPNGFQTESFSPIHKAVRNGKRSSAWTEYLEPIENTRSTLTVIRYANVSQILINKEKEAYGVAYTHHGIPQVAYANKEVVISAGTFQSPLLLMKSGIGPVKILKDANIPVKVPLEAIGQNLDVHPRIALSPFFTNDSSLFDRINGRETEEMWREWHATGEGRLGSLYNVAQCFIASSKAEPGWPDIFIAIRPHVIMDSGQPMISLFVTHGRPKSLGYISLNSTAYRQGVRDDVQLALVDFKLLTHPEDIEVLVEGIKFVLKIAEDTNAFKSLNTTYGADPDDACATYKFRSDDYWKCYISQNTIVTHVTGTCKMGPQNGNSDFSVVDPKFRVRGVQNLRVVDGSVMPAMVNSNTNAPVLMIAEKGAEDILYFYGNISGNT